MDGLAARAITESLEGAIAWLTQSLEYAKAPLSHAEFDAFQRTIGLTIARLSHEVLDPIYAEHPQLEPPGAL